MQNHQARAHVEEQTVRHFSIRLKRPYETVHPFARNIFTKLPIDSPELEGKTMLWGEGCILEITQYTPTPYAVKNRLFEEGDVRWSVQSEDAEHGAVWYLNRHIPFPADVYDEIRVLRKGTKVRLINVPQLPRVTTESYEQWLGGIGIGLHADNDHVSNVFAEARKPKYQVYTAMVEIAPGLWTVNMDTAYTLRREMFLTEELHVIQAWEE